MAAKPLPPVEYLRECFDYDPEIGILTWRVRPLHHFNDRHEYLRWNTRYSKKQAGSKHGRSDGIGFYLRTAINGIFYRIHLIAWKMHYGIDAAHYVDHRDGNGLNNAIENLREATHSQNAQNAGMRTKQPGKLKGTSKRKNKWQSEIRTDGKRIWLGEFTTEEEAHAAYRAASIQLHGEFSIFHADRKSRE